MGGVKKDWVMVTDCPAGTIATGSNNATHVVECVECPPQKACIGEEGKKKEATPWVLGCGGEEGKYYLKGENNATHVAECVECPPQKACTGNGTIVRDWVYDCASPGYYLNAEDNNSTHVAECKLCPWNFSCVNVTHKIPWVWECPAGSYGVGANTKNSTARCRSPCPVAYHACMGNRATIVNSDPLLEDGYEVSRLPPK
jgi:hypothetical protein